MLTRINFWNLWLGHKAVANLIEVKNQWKNYQQKKIKGLNWKKNTIKKHSKQNNTIIKKIETNLDIKINLNQIFRDKIKNKI
jgi:hypothetical protein